MKLREIDPRTPVIIGAGQSVDRVGSGNYHSWSASDLAAAAATSALRDTDGDVAAISAAIQAVATTRTFEDSLVGTVLFGKSSNFPRSVTQRLGIDPTYALWAKAGGNSPQDLVAEMCERIASGAFDVALIAGAEAISTVRHAKSKGLELDFSEDPGGDVEDRGAGIDEFLDPLSERHGMVGAPAAYALAENARRHRKGLSKMEYAHEMGELFAPFAEVAHSNPFAAWDVPTYSPDELVKASPHNRWIADPYPIHLVARDQVNMGAAIVIASVAKAIELGVPDDKLVFLHGYATGKEKPFLARADIGASPAARAVAHAALENAGISLESISHFDFYSCFPIAVSNVAIDAFGLSPGDARKLTITGGLPFFGGPGNNYSMHALAQMVSVLRQSRDSTGFLGANGGYLSKYSAGIYSCRPRDWKQCESTSLQAKLDAEPSPPIAPLYTGTITVETYTVIHNRNGPHYAVIIGKNDVGERVIARTAADDQASAARIHQTDILGTKVRISCDGDTNVVETASPM